MPRNLEIWEGIAKSDLIRLANHPKKKNKMAGSLTLP
jgi:hypothetical protein